MPLFDDGSGGRDVVETSPVDAATDGVLRRIGVDGNGVATGTVVVLQPRNRAAAGDGGAPASMPLAAALAEVLERRLGGADRFIRGDGGMFAVAFADDVELVARLRCAQVLEELADATADNGIRGTGIDVATVRRGNGTPRLAWAPMTRTLEDAVQALTHRDDGSPPPQEDDDPNDALGPDLEFVFRPILEVRTKLVSTFQCIPVRAVTGGSASGYGVLADDAPERILELDLAVLDKVGEASAHRNRSRGRSSMALTVHFATLSNPGRRDRYLDACSARLGRSDSSLVLELAGLPADGDVRRIVERAADLLPGARRLFVRCGDAASAIRACRSIGAHAIGIDFYDRSDDEPTIMQSMDGFAAAARRGRLRSYVLGVRSISLYTAAVAGGFDYVAGHALSPVVRDTEEIHRFRPDVPYLTLLNAVGSPRPER